MPLESVLLGICRGVKARSLKYGRAFGALVRGIKYGELHDGRGEESLVKMIQEDMEKMLLWKRESILRHRKVLWSFRDCSKAGTSY
jgi:hypothetical protein